MCKSKYHFIVSIVWFFITKVRCIWFSQHKTYYITNLSESCTQKSGKLYLTERVLNPVKIVYFHIHIFLSVSDATRLEQGLLYQFIRQIAYELFVEL